MQTIRSTKVINSGTAAQSLLSPAADAEPDTCARVGEQPELPAALRRQLLCRLLPVLTLGYGLSFIDRSNIAYAELEMGRAIGIDARTFGLASGIFFAGYGPMQIPVVHLVARVGARRVLAGTLFVWGLLASLMGSVNGPVLLCVLRFCLGLAEAGYYPGALYFLSTWLPSELNGTAAAMFTCLGIPMAVLGSLSSGAILTYPVFDCLLGLEAWRWLFIMQGAPAVLLSLILLAQLPDTPATSRWLSAEHRQLLTTALTQGAADGRTTASSATTSSSISSTSITTTTPTDEEVADEPVADVARDGAERDGAERGALALSPLPLRDGLSRTIPRLTTWIFALQHFAGATVACERAMAFAPHRPHMHTDVASPSRSRVTVHPRDPVRCDHVLRADVPQGAPAQLVAALHLAAPVVHHRHQHTRRHRCCVVDRPARPSLLGRCQRLIIRCAPPWRRGMSTRRWRRRRGRHCQHAHLAAHACSIRWRYLQLGVVCRRWPPPGTGLA